MVAELARVIHLRQPHHETLAGGHVGEHLRQQILYHLVGRDRLAELQPLLGVLQRGLERAHLDAGRGPTDHVPRHAQHTRGVAERIATLQPVRFRHAHVLQRDLAVLDDLEGNLVLDLLDAEAGRGLVLDDETLDLVVGFVAGPDDRHVAPWRIADPLLLAIEDPGIAIPARRGQEAAAGAGTHERLGEAEAADLLHPRHRRQPLLLLLLGAREVDRAHRESVVHAEESGHRRIDPSQLHGHEAEQLLAAAPAAIALEAKPTDIELTERRQKLERESILGPILADNRRHRRLQVGAHLLQQRHFVRRQGLGDLVEITLGDVDRPDRQHVVHCAFPWRSYRKRPADRIAGGVAY